MQRIWSYVILSILAAVDFGISTEQNIATSECIYQKGPFIASRGTEGKRGHRGHRGERGRHGKEGRVGKIGHKGIAGFRGLQGPPGYVGPVGLPGIDGNDGPAGPQGVQGPIGSTGPQGALGSSPATLFDPSSPFIWDEFISGNSQSGTIGSLGWTLATGQVSPTLPPGPSANHPGILELISSGATGATGFGSLLQLSGSAGSVYLPDPFDVKMIVRINAESPTQFGFFSQDLLTFVCFTAQTPSGLWSIQWNNGTLKTHATTVPVTSDWVQLRMFRPQQNGNVQFYINNALVFNLLATEVPSSALNLNIGTETSATEGTVDIDYVSVLWPSLSR